MIIKNLFLMLWTYRLTATRAGWWRGEAGGGPIAAHTVTAIAGAAKIIAAIDFPLSTVPLSG
jgi:hypothetical protein